MPPSWVETLDSERHRDIALLLNSTSYRICMSLTCVLFLMALTWALFPYMTLPLGCLFPSIYFSVQVWSCTAPARAVDQAHRRWEARAACECRREDMLESGWCRSSNDFGRFFQVPHGVKAQHRWTFMCSSFVIWIHLVKEDTKWHF